MKITSGLLAIALLTAACGSTPRQQPKPGPSIAEGTGFLQKGPTVAIDTKPPKNTTLQKLEEKLKENAQLKGRLEAAERGRTDAERRASEADLAVLAGPFARTEHAVIVGVGVGGLTRDAHDIASTITRRGEGFRGLGDQARIRAFARPPLRWCRAGGTLLPGVHHS